jgi:hypothetical protein
MPKFDPKLTAALDATGPVAAACVISMRDGTWESDDLAARLLPVMADMPQMLALVGHLSRLAVVASTPDDLAEQLVILEKLGRR